MVANRVCRINHSETGLVKFVYDNRSKADHAYTKKINEAEARKIILEMGWVANEETLPRNLMVCYRARGDKYYIIYDVRNLMSGKS